MEDLPVNILDIVIAVAVIISGFIGLWFGLTRTALFVLSWVGAAAATYYAYPQASPIARQYIETEWVADGAAGVGVFVVVLGILVVLSSIFGGWIHKSRLAALDRSLGMVVGLLTGAFLVLVVFLGYAWVTPAKQYPQMVQDAKATPYLEIGAVRLLSVIPPEWIDTGQEKKEEAEKKFGEATAMLAEGKEANEILQLLLHPAPKKEAAKDAKEKQSPEGYASEARTEMDRLMQADPATASPPQAPNQAPATE